MLLTKVADQGLLEGVDVRNVYLYGNLYTHVVVERPTDSTGMLRKPNHVSLVVMFIYGKKAAGSI